MVGSGQTLLLSLAGLSVGGGLMRTLRGALLLLGELAGGAGIGRLLLLQLLLLLLACLLLGVGLVGVLDEDGAVGSVGAVGGAVVVAVVVRASADASTVRLQTGLDRADDLSGVVTAEASVHDLAVVHDRDTVGDDGEGGLSGDDDGGSDGDLTDDLDRSIDDHLADDLDGSVDDHLAHNLSRGLDDDGCGVSEGLDGDARASVHLHHAAGDLRNNGGVDDSLVDRLGKDGLLVLDDITVQDGLDLLDDLLVESLLDDRGVLDNVHVGGANNSSSLGDELRGNSAIIVDQDVLSGQNTSGVLGGQHLGLVHGLNNLLDHSLLDITLNNGLNVLLLSLVDLLLNELDIMGDDLGNGDVALDELVVVNLVRHCFVYLQRC